MVRDNVNCHKIEYFAQVLNFFFIKKEFKLCSLLNIHSNFAELARFCLVVDLYQGGSATNIATPSSLV